MQLVSKLPVKRTLARPGDFRSLPPFCESYSVVVNSAHCTSISRFNIPIINPIPEELHGDEFCTN